MKSIGFVVALAVVSVCEAATPQLQFAWKQVDYTWETPDSRENAIKEKRFIPENNHPVGLARWKNKLFVTVPRWRPGVVSTLNYVDLDGPQDQLFKPYPSFQDNFVPDTATELPSNNSLISVFRVFVDECDRLWVLDTGKADRLGARNQINGPAIVIFDLKTDKLIHRYQFKPTDDREGSFFANIVVEVNKETCDDAYAYAADLGAYGLVVYSLKQNDSWRILHHYFFLDPLSGSYNVSGLDFQWKDGLFGVALSEPKENGFRTMFFHAMSSTKEFYVSTEVLRNYKNLNPMKAYHDFKLLGDRGERTQSAASFYDTKNHVLFYTQVQRYGVACWNSKKPFTLENNPLILSDPKNYEFTSDVKMDDEDILWIFTDKVPRYFYRQMDLNPNEINYRIFSINTKQAIEGTACE